MAARRPLCAPEAQLLPPAAEAAWKARAGARVSRRNLNRNARLSGCSCHSGCIAAPEDAEGRTRTAARLAAWGPRSGAEQRTGRAVRTWPGGRRTAAPPTAWVLRVAWAVRVARVGQRARGLAVASARRRPPRLKPGDSRSPDRTSVTRGFLCRSGYTSPTIAQSVVPRFHYFKQSPE